MERRRIRTALGPEAYRDVRLAVIDCDSGFLRVLGNRLKRAGWKHRVLASPVPLHALTAMRLHAVVIDPAILGPHGWTYLEEVGAGLPHLGVLVCTGRSSVAQRVRGLRLGADDWLTKPCHPEEVIARVEAVVRRRRLARTPLDGEPLRIGELEIRAGEFQAYVADSSLGLTRREFELLQLLAQTSGQVLPREEIYQRLWGYSMARGDRSVDVYVRRLRSKLERLSPEWRYIHTHIGVGYRCAAQPIEQPEQQQTQPARAAHQSHRDCASRRLDRTSGARPVLPG